MDSHAITSHSADVDMWLDCGQHGNLELCRITPTFLVFTRPKAIPPGEAELVVVVDGTEMRSRVMLPNGVSPDQPRVMALAVDQIAPF